MYLKFFKLITFAFILSVFLISEMSYAQISTFPWSDDLENPGAPGVPAGWTQDIGDDFDWTFDAGGTGSSGTGPSVDHNPGTSLGTYGYTEATGPSAGDIANISSPQFDLTGLTNPVFSFWYHMYGAAMGTLNVDYSTDGGTTWTNAWTLSGDQGDVWLNAEVAIPTNADYVRFSGVIGSSFTSDMAFDDVSIYDNVSPPNCAINVTPPDGEDSVVVFTNLEWADGGGGTEGYYIYFGTDNPPTNIENGTDLGNVTSYTPSTTLTTGTTYYWQIVAYNVNGNSTGCAIWSFESYPDAALSGVYTVGLTDFIQKTGKQVYFETRTRTVTRKITPEDPYIINEETKTQTLNRDMLPRYVTVTETYKELMENGKPFDRSFYMESPDAVYPTLTEAINDLNLRGVSGPVEFSLVDSYYPNETYPIDVGEVFGASSTNTITIKPASGIQADIPGDINQIEASFRLFDTDWLILDGSNSMGGTTKDLRIAGVSGTVRSAAIYLEGNPSNNVFKNLILESTESSTGYGTFTFSDPSVGMDNNLVQNCTIKDVDTLSSDRPYVGVYTYTANVGDGNQVIDCEVYNWYYYGIRQGGGPSTNGLISGCDVYQTAQGTTSPYGIYVLGAEGLIVEKCKIREIIGSSTTRGVYVAGNSSYGSFVFRNNFISLSGTTNLTSGTSFYGLDYFGYAANSFEAYHNSIYIGGTDVTTGSSYALTCRDDATTFKAYNNAVHNARSNSTGTGTHYAIYVSDTNQVTREIDYNDFIADGSGGTFGYYQGPGAIADLATWKTTTGLDANSLSADPGFVGNDDLHIKTFINTLDGQGMYFASVPDDIDSDTRNMTTPDIGADEYTYAPPSVIDPSDVTATAISFDQIDVGFTPNGSSDNVVIIFNLDGNFTTPSGTPPAVGQPFAGGTLIANTTTSPVNHSGLTELTTYYYKLFSYDGANYSFGVTAIATTPIAPFTSFPYLENFDNGGSIPNGWMQDAGNSENWLFGTSATYAAGSDHTSGTGYFAWIDDSSPDNAYPSGLVSPPFDVTGLTAPRAAFWYWIGVDNPSAGPSYLNVDISTDGGTSWTDSVVTALVENNQWDAMSVDLTSFSSSNLLFRFSAFEDQGSFYCDLSVDDFSLYDATSPPNCAVNVSPPDMEDSVNVFTSLDWSSGGGDPTGYLIYFGTDNPPTNIENGTDLGNVTTYTPSTSLSAATTYYWQIIAYNGNGNSTGCAVWSFETFPDAPLSGTYTVGLSEFINKTGKKVYFEERTRTVTKNINGVDAVEDINTVNGETKNEILEPDLSPRYVEITETYFELMENGKPFDRKFYQESEDGVYPTITEAVNDLNARGVSGPVTFSLVDTYYPSETYPILIGEIGGASSTNTITIKPAAGIQAEIPGNIAQTTASIQVGYGDWVIIDGSNTPGGTTKDLKVVGLASGTIPSIHLWGDASNNVFKNLVIESQNSSTGSGTFLFGAGPFASDNNVVQNCTIKMIDTIATKPGVGGYFFSSNTGTGNQFIDCDIYDWNSYGLRLQGAPTTNTLVSGCDIYQLTQGSTSPYAVYVSRVDGLVVEKCKIYNMIGTSTIRGIYLAGNSTSGDFTLRNNFVSISGSTDLTSGSIYGIDYFGYAANSFEAYFNSVYVGGTGVTSGSSYAFAVRDDATNLKVYDNAVHNARSNGTGTGTHYAVYISDTNQVVREYDYNDFFADGAGGTFGFYQGPGAIADLATWKTATGLDGNSLSADPGFVGNDDLHIKPFINNLDGMGMYFASVPNDIDGDTRNATTPDIGADEYTYVPPSVIDPSDVTATAVNFDQIDVGFTPNGSNDNVVIVFNLDGNFTTPSGPPPVVGQPFAGGTLIANTITSPYNHTGLTELTTYYYKLFSYDGANYSFGVTANATTPSAPISSFPWNDDLENPGQPSTPLGWTQDTGDDFDWTFDADGTPSSDTGPSIDHNPGTSTGTYGFTESSSNYGTTANISTPPFDVSALTNPVFSFWYHMYGATMGTLSVDYSTNGGTSWNNGWSESGDKGDTWYLGEVVLPTDANLVRISGLTGSSFTSDMAFDDVTIYDNPNPPNCAVNVSPSDGVDSVSIFTGLDWASGGGAPTGYKLFFGTDNPPTNIVNGADLGNVTTYVPVTTLSNGTTYYWQVIAYNPVGDAASCGVWSFTTHPDAPLAGDYTVGLTEFNRITGKNIYFEEVVTKVMTEVDVEVLAEKGTNDDKTSFKPKTESKLMEVEEISWIPMENGEPYTGDLYVYKESSPQYNYPEGTDGVYTTLTAAVADLNFRGVGGDVNFLLTDATYTTGETYPLVLDFGNLGSNTVTIKPNTGVTALVQGSSPSGQIFMILSSYVTIDGSNAGGTDRSLTLENTSTTSPQVVAIGSVGDVPITDVTLKNSVVINGAQTSSAVVISDGIAPGSSGYFNDITVQNNHIQKAYIGAYCNAIAAPGNGSGLLLTENDLDSAGTQGIRYIGLYMQGTDGATVSHNHIANFNGTTSEDDRGIWLATDNTNTTVEKNYIHSLNYTGTGGYGAQGIVVSSITLNANILIKNNMIYDISGDGWGVSIPGDNPYGIYIFGSIAQSGIMMYHNSINLFGNTLSSTNAISAGIAIGTNSSGDLQNNIIVNNLGVDDLGVGSIGVWLQSDSTQLETSNYNDIFVNATGSGVNYVGQIAATGYADLASWQTGSGADANSISADPGFISNTDLHIDVNSTTVSGKGIYLASVPMDIDGDTRLDPPDIGADEYEASTSTFAFSIDVGNGWNMVSAPGLHPTNQNVETWWSGKDPGAGVFKYAGGYVAVTTTTPSEGYWMKNVGAQTYNYAGIQIVPHNDVPLALGWNLIGLYENTVVLPLTTSPPGIITTPVFEYSGGYVAATDIKAGYGYWAKADQAGSITGLSAPPLGKENGEVVEFFPDKWGRIILTDASGINYTLYAVTGDVDLNKYELPPMPPEGMFDIRYGSGRIAEDINSSLQEIQLTGVTYPLTVKVEGMDMRVMDETGKTINANLRDGEDVVISDAQISKLMVSGELLPTVYALEQNYPNPFNPSTTIEFSLPEDVNNVTISIYNVLGEKVAELVNTALVAGKYKYQWNGTNIASGMYIYELRTDKFVSVKKMMLLK